jgi:DNA-binding PadR family transcriptional regulator
VRVNPTRLLVLGAIRALQPVHGYQVRRELITWRLEERANLRPGSIYGAIQTLEREGLIAVHSHESEAGRPDRTEYVLTPEGEKELLLMLREAWWTVRPPVEPLLPALTLMGFMSREELVRALQARIGFLEGEIESMGFMRGTIRDGATGADGDVPEHVREIVDFIVARDRSELEWSRELQRRLRAGAYGYLDSQA